MMLRVVRLLAGKQSEAEAWDALFRYFNRNAAKEILDTRGAKRLLSKSI